MWSPFCDDRFATSKTRLSIFNVKVDSDGQRFAKLSDYRDINNISCMQWSPHQKDILAYGCSSSSVGVVNCTTPQSTSSDIVLKKSIRKMCTDLSWNPLLSHQLAGGFDKQRGDCSGILWDVVKGAEIMKLSFEEAVSATCWVNVSGISNNTVDIDSASSALETPVNPSLSQSNPTSYPLLALGTTVGWVKMYDPRVNRSSGDASSPEFSVVAHMSTRPRKVQGIRQDPFYSNIFATFSDVSGEPAKVWDLRKIHSSKGKLASHVLTIDPYTHYAQSFHSVSSVAPSAQRSHSEPTASISDVCWCSTRSNMLAISLKRSQDPYAPSSVKANPPHNPSLSVNIGKINGTTSRLAGDTAGHHIEPLMFFSTIKPTSNNTSAAEPTSHSPMLSVDLSLPSVGSIAKLSWQTVRDDTTSLHRRLLVTSTQPGVLLDVVVPDRSTVALAVGSSSTDIVAVSCNHAAGGIRNNSAALYGVHSPSVPKSEVGSDVNGGQGLEEGLVHTTSHVANTIMIVNTEHLPSPHASTVMPLPGPGAIASQEHRMRRRCQQGYGLTPGKNLQILSDEIDSMLSTINHSTGPRVPSSTTGMSVDTNTHHLQSAHQMQQLHHDCDVLEELYRVWSWMYRTEESGGTLPGWEEQGDISDGVSKVTLTNGGVIQQLCNVGVDANAAGAGHSPALAYELPNASVCTFHSTLGTSMYQSASRGRARTVCGWFHLLVNVQQPYDKLNDSTSADVDAVDTDETVKGVKAGKNSYLGSNITSSLLNGGDSDESDESELDEDEEEPPAALLSEFLQANILIEDGFERAAALALFHGDREEAVAILQNHLDKFQRSQQVQHADSIVAAAAGGNEGEAVASSPSATPTTPTSTPASYFKNSHVLNVSQMKLHLDDECDYEEDEEETFPQDITVDYMNMVGMVAMCVAGYVPSEDPRQGKKHRSRKAKPSAWEVMCRHVLTLFTGPHADPPDTEDDDIFDYTDLPSSHTVHQPEGEKSFLGELRDGTLPEFKFARKQIVYLFYICTFLLSNVRPSTDEGSKGLKKKKKMSKSDVLNLTYGKLLLDDRLFLEDRAAFACLYVSDELLLPVLHFISNHQSRQRCGRGLSGLIITGLCSAAGVELLQQYVDDTDDVQTVALFAAHTLTYPCYSSSSSIEKEATTTVKSYSTTGGVKSGTSTNVALRVPGWNNSSNLGTKEGWSWLYIYRQLCNLWQCYQYRALLDVELGRRHRLSQPPGDAVGSGSGSKGSKGTSSVPHRGGPVGARGGRGAGGNSNVLLGQPSVRLSYLLPAHTQTLHAYLKCHYCGTSLPVDPLHSHSQADWLRKQRPIIECCSQCKNALPRCYVCRLHVSIINPQTEYSRLLTQRQMQQRLNPQSAGTSALQGSLSHDHKSGEDSILPLSRWFYFCQRCKHGGHACCIDDWFRNTSSGQCGVNGCICRCND